MRQDHDAQGKRTGTRALVYSRKVAASILDLASLDDARPFGRRELARQAHNAVARRHDVAIVCQNLQVDLPLVRRKEVAHECHRPDLVPCAAGAYASGEGRGGAGEEKT